jgi:hypothetical protein
VCGLEVSLGSADRGLARVVSRCFCCVVASLSVPSTSESRRYFCPHTFHLLAYRLFIIVLCVVFRVIFCSWKEIFTGSHQLFSQRKPLRKTWVSCWGTVHMVWFEQPTFVSQMIMYTPDGKKESEKENPILFAQRRDFICPNLPFLLDQSRNRTPTPVPSDITIRKKTMPSN